MTETQKRAVAEMLRTGPLDLGGEVHEQRRVLVEMLTAFPSPDDVVATPGRLGGIDVVTVDIAGVSTDDVVLYLHGGAYALGTAASSVGLVGDLVRRSHARGITVDYRLAPESPFPAAREDAVTAYAALLEVTEPGHVAVVGESAGGGLRPPPRRERTSRSACRSPPVYPMSSRPSRRSSTREPRPLMPRANS